MPHQGHREPVFKLQLVSPDGAQITFPLGGTLERNLVEAIADQVEQELRVGVRARLLTAPLGFWKFRTKGQVLRAVDRALDGLQPTLQVACDKVVQDLKWDGRYTLHSRIGFPEAIEAAEDRT